jgi:ubiquinone/menaquinone biosynthesis C-methylase UbiE
MSTYILMKILESAPSRYDKGIRFLTCGKLDSVYDRLTAHIHQGQRVLDIGCGTGALSLRAAQRGANVKAIDINPQMLEIARQRADDAQHSSKIEFCEMGVAELGNEASDSYDTVMSGLCLSELTTDELNYTILQSKRILKPGGLLLVADEVNPKRIVNKILVWLIRIPLLIITYVLTQTTTRAIKGLSQKIADSGFIIHSIRVNKLKNFIEIVAQKPCRTNC